MTGDWNTAWGKVSRYPNFLALKNSSRISNPRPSKLPPSNSRYMKSCPKNTCRNAKDIGTHQTNYLSATVDGAVWPLRAGPGRIGKNPNRNQVGDSCAKRHHAGPNFYIIRTNMKRIPVSHSLAMYKNVGLFTQGDPSDQQKPSNKSTNIKKLQFDH